MNLKTTILAKHSKEQCERVVQWVGQSQQRFDELFTLFIKDEKLVAQRAAWAVSDCAKQHPGFIADHYSALLTKLQETGNHVAVKRNSMRLLEFVTIPEAFQGKIMSMAFDCIASPLEAVAVKASCITVLGNLAKEHPDILPELRTIVLAQYENEKPAFKSRAKKLFKDIR